MDHMIFYNNISLANGIVFCWGDNTAGQLGLNSSLQEHNQPKAVVTPPGATITMVACGANFTAALAGTYHTMWIT